MALAEGTRLGPYEIQGVIGAGGMGEVYKAQDTRLNRMVAIKIMPDHVSGRDDMKARFEREAQTIAGLNHPNICTLHDIGHEVPEASGAAPAEPGTANREPRTDSIDFLVLEHIEGETLTDRIARGPIPLAEALEIAIKVADALDKAHKEGVIHRDLKPGNVMLAKTGPKLLDFGLAKWTQSGEAGALAALPTRADVTAKGTMLGTLQYMAPEQIEGKQADARTDIFAFGALLYEMVTGKRAFEGKSQATLISAIMGREPRPMSHLVPVSPAALEHVVERALAKNPDDRWQSAHSLVIQLKWIAYGDAEGVAPVSTDDTRRERVTMIALAATVLLATVMAVPAFLYFQDDAAGEPFLYRSPVRGYEDAALAPDGSGIVFTARPTDGASSLYYRPIGGLTSVRLDGTSDAAQPFWAPDSRFVGFVAGGTLKKIDVTGGPAQSLAQVSGFTGGTWNEAGTILFGSSAGLFRVSAEGGTAEAVTAVEEPETGHFWPRFLPDGEQYVFLAWSAEPAGRTLYAGSLSSAERTRLLDVESGAVYAEPGYLLYQRGTAVYAQPFDPGAPGLDGEPVRVAGGVAVDPDGRGAFDVSQTGTLIYFENEGGGAAAGRGGENPNGAFAWVSRSGTPQEPVGEPGPYGDMDLSPNGALVAVTRVDGTGDIWIIDWQRGEQGVPTRLTLDPANDVNPVWSPDGARVAFSSDRNGNMDVFVMNANGVGEAEPLLASQSEEMVEAWSRDGEYIAYLSGSRAQRDIWVLPLSGDREPFPVVEGPFDKDEPQFSHDGKWLAYTSNESGEFEVYVMSFPEGDQREKASEGGGGQPRWSPGGGELYYRAPGGSAMAVTIATEPRLVVGSPRQLFNLPFQRGYSDDPVRHQWAVSPDGQRFLARAPHLRPAAGGRGRRGAAQAPTSYTPAGTATAAAPAGRGALAVENFGLTVVLDWPAAARQGDR